MAKLSPTFPGEPAGHPSVAVGQIDERGGDGIDDVVVLDVAGDGDDRRAGRVVVGVEAPDVARR